MDAINRTLPKVKKKATHHAALPFAEIAGFMEMLCNQESVGRLALETLILTAARSGEIRHAIWQPFLRSHGLDVSLMRMP